MTAPDAVCWVHAEGDDDPAHRLRVYADPEGVARFHVRPEHASNELARLVIDAHAGGRVTRQPLHLRADHLPTAEMPAPPVDLPKAPAGSTTRPALSREQAAALSHKDMLDGGYPMAPDPDHAPAAYEHWLQLVAVPMTIVEAKSVISPDISHGRAERTSNPTAGNATSANWCGYELLRSLRFIRGPLGFIEFALTDPYDWITGTWRVPAVSGESFKQTNSSFWVGLDGDGTTDLVQAGTESDNLTLPFPFFGPLSLSTFYAWTEFLPQQPTEQTITNFPVRAGDEIMTEVWMGDAAGDPSLSGYFGRFLIMNLTTGLVTQVYTPRGTTTVGGTEAVWIMERPTFPFGLPDLADFRSATMYDVLARRINSARQQGYVSYLTGATKVNTMTNLAGTDTLCTVNAIDSASMRFDWQAFN
jgi:hypothetical protein